MLKRVPPPELEPTEGKHEVYKLLQEIDPEVLRIFLRTLCQKAPKADDMAGLSELLELWLSLSPREKKTILAMMRTLAGNDTPALRKL